MEEVVGFSQLQRQWILARDEHRCQFHTYDGKKWVRCRATEGLQVHHIVARGFSKYHMPPSFQLNGSMNGISLCKYHHVGKYGVHPDTYTASVAYHKGSKTAFEDMMARRKVLNLQGKAYWNTQWDWMFNRIARKATLKYARIHPYPVNENRGNSGRLPPT